MTRGQDHIVITQNLVTVSDDDWMTVYGWDGTRWPTRDQAVDHGFTLGRADDFNVAVLEGSELTWFGWMDDELPEADRFKVAACLDFSTRRSA